MKSFHLLLALTAMVSPATPTASGSEPLPAPAAAESCTQSDSTALVSQGGAQLAARAEGHGPGVLLIPSLGRGAGDYDHLSTVLVAAGYRVIRFEPRWFSPSDGPEDADLFVLAADALAVADALCGAPVDIVGHAFGNRVARAAASSQPDRVRTVTLLAAGGLTPLAPEVRAAIEGSVAQGLKPDAERLSDLRLAFFAQGQDPSVWLDGWNPRAATLQSAATQRTPREAWWSGGRAPILVIQASEDPVAPLANGEALRAGAPDRVVALRLDHASHAMLPEQPDAIAAALTAWLGGERNPQKLQTRIDLHTRHP